MRNQAKAQFFFSIALVLVAGFGLLPDSVQAYPSLFDNRCASCHSDDTPTCDGCHEHHGNVSAEADQTVYDPGSIVTVTLKGGSRGGWVRGLLYDQDGSEVARATGPTGSGDNGAGNPVTFPVTLQASAPAVPGQYT